MKKFKQLKVVACHPLIAMMGMVWAAVALLEQSAHVTWAAYFGDGGSTQDSFVVIAAACGIAFLWGRAAEAERKVKRGPRLLPRLQVLTRVRRRNAA
jgi:hypothetical protein